MPMLVTYMSLMVLDSPKKRDSGGIHFTGSRAFEVRNIMNGKRNVSCIVTSKQHGKQTHTAGGGALSKKDLVHSSNQTTEGHIGNLRQFEYQHKEK